MKELFQIIRLVGQSVISEVQKLRSVINSGNDKVVEAIKGISPGQTKQEIKVDLKDTNKLLYDLIEEAKRKEEIEISEEDFVRLKGEPGSPGEPGLTPIKGKDYFTDKEVLDFLKKSTPVKGIHYKDGEDGSPDTPEEIAKKLNTLESAVDAKVIRGLPKTEIIRGGGSSGVKRFINLLDTPSTLAGSGGKSVVVKEDESALEFGEVDSSLWKVEDDTVSLKDPQNVDLGTNSISTGFGTKIGDESHYVEFNDSLAVIFAGWAYPRLDGGYMALSVDESTYIYYSEFEDDLQFDTASGLYRFWGIGAYHAILDTTDLTDGRTFTLPDASGTLALTSDIVDGYVPYTGATDDLDLGANSIDTSVGYLFNGRNALKMPTKGDAVENNSVIIGRMAGDTTNDGTTAYQVAIGYVAGNVNTGKYQTAIGVFAGQNNSGSDQVAIGPSAGRENAGELNVAIGDWACYRNLGDNVIGIGEDATRDNSGDDVIAIGYQAGKDNVLDNQFIIQQANINVTPLIQGDFSTGNITIGGSIIETTPTLYKLDQSTPQDIVPIAGTTMSLSYKDIVGGGLGVFPKLKFTNSNLIEVPTKAGLLDYGLFIQNDDNDLPSVGFIGSDLATKPFGLIEFDASGDGLFKIQTDAAYEPDCQIILEKTAAGGDQVPVIGGRYSAGNKLLLFDTNIGLWDKEDTGNVNFFALNSDSSLVSVVFNWNSTTRTYTYTGAGGMVISNGAGDIGTTTTPLTLRRKDLGDGGDNDGMRLAFEHRSTAGFLGTGYVGGYIDCIQTDATELIMDTYLSFGGYTDGASEQWLKLDGTESLFSKKINVTGADSEIGDGSNYWIFDTVDFGVTGSVPLLRAVNPDFALGTNIGSIADFLVIYDYANAGQTALAFALNGLAGTCALIYDGSDLILDIDFIPSSDDRYDLGENGSAWQYGWFKKDINLYADTYALKLGQGGDMSVYYDGTDGYIKTDLVAPSDLKIDCGTDKTIELEESVWDDIQFNVESGMVSAANYPDWDATFTTNTGCYKFDVDDYIDLGTNEMKHDWKEATSIYPHVHIALDGANASGGSQYVKFVIYIAYADHDAVYTETNKEIEIEIPDGTADMTHLLGQATALAMTGLGIGTQINVRLKRIEATSGTEYPNHIFVTQVGIHYEVCRLGSRTIGAA